MTMKPAIIIPVYNHGDQIAGVLQCALTLDLPVIVVDDGSTDTTSQAVEAFSEVTIVRHSVNQGKGAALLSGFAAAIKQQCDCAITIDGDGQHKPLDAKSLLQAAEKGKRCIVIGKRLGMEDSENVPWTSKFGRKFSNFWVWVSGGPMVEDSQSGFRFYPLPEVVQLDVKARRYQYEVEVLAKARQQGIQIKEAPVSVVYQAKGVRVSHFRPWLDFWRNSLCFSRLIFSRIFRIFLR